MQYKKLLLIGGGIVSGGGLFLSNLRSILVNNTDISKTRDEHNGNVWDSNWDKRSNMKPRGTRNIILIRHGQYNYGKTDQEKTLTELGKKQAVYTGIRLAELGLDKKLNVVFESTMTRAHETSELIYRQLNADIPIQKTDLLREGCPTFPDPPFKGGEVSLERVERDSSRMDESFEYFMHRADADQDGDSYELFVCHGNLIRYFLCKLLQLPTSAMHRWRLRHCSITWVTIRPSGNVSLRLFGDTGHLPSDKLTFE
uniref:Serine/threonine-protein phosphatase PGAM5, mitochondrial n=1 Tax=Phallusia mammillata TaxID=59560 RepID=A0A6F9DN00_9ASCI|nr:serine/threonine-protein phosphatase PGAM5, mitochondrial-like [Phallusia mammillata]